MPAHAAGEGERAGAVADRPVGLDRRRQPGAAHQAADVEPGLEVAAGAVEKEHAQGGGALAVEEGLEPSFVAVLEDAAEGGDLACLSHLQGERRRG